MPAARQRTDVPAIETWVTGMAQKERTAYIEIHVAARHPKKQTLVFGKQPRPNQEPKLVDRFSKIWLVYRKAGKHRDLQRRFLPSA